MKKNLLEVENLHAWYGESHVLQGVNMHVGKGETICILGRNGMGKTTTLRAIIGLIRKRTGTINMGKTNLMAMPLHRVAYAGLALVPEERGIFANLTVEENLMLPPKVAEGGMQLGEIYQLFPNLFERRRSPGTKLSGGEQQMLAIARVLRTGANCILLDEPTEGLAPVIVQKIGEAIQSLKGRGLTLVLVEQNFHFASSVADRFYLMDHGRMTSEFPVGQLAENLPLLTRELGV